MGGDANNFAKLGLASSLLGSGTQLLGAIQGGKQGQRTANIGRPVAQIGGTLANYGIAQQDLQQRQAQREAYTQMLEQRMDLQQDKLEREQEFFSELRRRAKSIPANERGALDLAIKSGNANKALSTYETLEQRQRDKSAINTLLPKVIRDDPESAAVYSDLASRVGVSQALVQFRADQAQKAASLKGERDARRALMQEAELEGKKLTPTQKQIMTFETNLPQIFVPGISKNDLRTRVQSLLSVQKVPKEEQGRFLKTVDEAYKAAQTKTNFFGAPTEASRDLFVEEFLKKNYPPDAINSYKEIAQRQQQLRQQAGQGVPVMQATPNQWTPEAQRRLEELRRRKGMQ